MMNVRTEEKNAVMPEDTAVLAALCAEYPKEWIRTVPFGKSYVGRQISALQLGNGTHRLCYIGGVNGGCVSSALLLRFAADYLESIRSGRCVGGIDIAYLCHTRTITVVPMLNPDGAVLRTDKKDPASPVSERLAAICGTEAFGGWETNGRGVDLRCNYDYKFSEAMLGGSRVGAGGYPGSHPESEPESAAVGAYLRASEVTDLTLTLSDGTQTHGDVTWSHRADHRTETIGKLIGDAVGFSAYASSAPGSLRDYYTASYGCPLLECTLPYTDSADESDVRALYARMRQSFFRGAVL